MQYYIGVDGGGTKTAVCAASIDNWKLHYTETKGFLWRELGARQVAENLKETAASLLRGEDCQIAGIAMGLPCHGESADGDRALEQLICGEFPGVPIYFTNDVEAGWAGSLALAPGINIVAGTGAIAFGKDGYGSTVRSGGWSEFFGDEGSCYWLGRKVMELFSKQSDGRMKRDELYETVRSELKLKDDFSFIDLVHSKYIGNRKQVASLQFLAEKAALAGSQSAKALYKEAVDELLLLVTSIRGQLDFSEKPFTVSYTGGLFKAGEFVMPLFSQGVEKEGGVLKAPLFAAVDGAVLLAFQHFKADGLEQIKKLLTEKE